MPHDATNDAGRQRLAAGTLSFPPNSTWRGLGGHKIKEQYPGGESNLGVNRINRINRIVNILQYLSLNYMFGSFWVLKSYWKCVGTRIRPLHVRLEDWHHPNHSRGERP